MYIHFEWYGHTRLLTLNYGVFACRIDVRTFQLIAMRLLVVVDVVLAVSNSNSRSILGQIFLEMLGVVL
jgi:hypothetical protein